MEVTLKIVVRDEVGEQLQEFLEERNSTLALGIKEDLIELCAQCLSKNVTHEIARNYITVEEVNASN